MQAPKFTDNKGLTIAVVAVVAVMLFFGLDSFVRRKRFDPPNQIEDYVEGRVTFDRVAKTWGKKEATESEQTAGTVPVDYFDEVPKEPPNVAAFLEGTKIAEQEVAFLSLLKSSMQKNDSAELDRLVFPDPNTHRRELFVGGVRDLCGHHISEIELDKEAPSPVEMPVDADGTKLQYVGKMLVRFDRADLPEFHMDAVTLNPKAWENPVGKTPDGKVFLIPVAEMILKQ